jgi:hypothetical protein
MTESQRPSKISASLKIIEAELTPKIANLLETYIESLEANQAKPLPEAEALNTPEEVIPPIWSHQRVREREEHQRKRALKKLAYYRPS